MSRVQPDTDLAALARTETAASIAPPKRRWLRFALPAAILILFAAILATSLRDVLVGALDVTVERPRPAESLSFAAEGAAVLQAAGWAEPDPFPTLATALAPGVVKQILVQESQAVAAGEPVAILVDDDARIGAAQAAAALDRARAEARRTAAEARITKEAFDSAVAVTEALESAEADERGRIADAKLRAEAAKKSEAAAVVAEQDFALARELADSGASGPFQIKIAEAKAQEARAEVERTRADAALAAAEAEKSAARARRARAEKKLRFDDTLRVESTAGAAAASAAALREAEQAAAAAALRLERMTVRAPAAGIVLERLATAGSVLESGGAGLPVCSLFDPAHLRVRVDVLLDDISKVSVGQRASVLSDARPGKPYQGEVIRLVQKADIQKKTLQAHVRLLDGDALLRPEMLCQVRFLAPRGAATRPGAAPSAVLVPARLLDGDALWVVDPLASRAVRRRVSTGARAGDWIEVTSGINITDKIIDEGRAALRDGSRVRVREEESHGSH